MKESRKNRTLMRGPLRDMGIRQKTGNSRRDPSSAWLIDNARCFVKELVVPFVDHSLPCLHSFVNNPRMKPRKTIARYLNFLALECLESRNLLAANIVGHWTADDLNHLDSGDAVPAWIDSTNGIAATPDGKPRLIKNALNGHSAVRFDPTDGDEDRLRVLAEHNPLDGAGDFTVATVFATSSQDLRGDSDTNWFNTTGLVDASLAGLKDDWGLAINGQGQVVAGLGRPTISQTSAQTGLNDGGVHVAVYTRSGGTISLYVDGVMSRRTDGGVAPRIARPITFGGTSIGPGFLEGDIAEVRLFDSELLASEVLELTAELRERYFNFAPTASDDEYSVDEDQLLTVTAGNGVLSNDSDAEQDTLNAVIVSQATHGTVDLSPDGSFTYQPDRNFAGIDSFNYVARDTRNSESTKVTINVLEQDDPALAVQDAYLAIVDQALVVTLDDGVLSNDVNLGSSELTAALIRDVQHGELTMASDGSFRYLPDLGFAGRDSFTYRADGGLLTSNEVQVDLQVNMHAIVISEVMAANRETLLDEDDDSSDWIELFNYGDVSVDMDGWYLTDDPDDLTGWQFPEVTLRPGHFLTVFASGKDRSNATGESHTDFRLASGGEYLALVAPDRQTIVSEFSYPLQLPDISYAISTKYSESVLLDSSSDAQVLVPQDDTLGLAWTAPDFEPDDSWSRGAAAIGFETGDVLPDRGEYASLILEDQPVGYWRLEESSGSVAQNSGTLGSAAYFTIDVNLFSLVKIAGRLSDIESAAYCLQIDFWRWRHRSS